MLLARICSPLEGKRMKNAGFPRAQSKIFTFEGEIMSNRAVTFIFVNGKLDF
jgi:hypothetical protein